MPLIVSPERKSTNISEYMFTHDVPQTKGESPGNGSVTVKLFNVTFPVLVVTKVYVIISPTAS
ncbi:hypothetical protein [Algibacter sp. 2305UL17-15]|uniref:hypothetical protein n=1 Tax=Algibacter sp. 2305UL17-15 TaxID=3231268 RepID=UPI00345ACE24